VWLPGSYGIQRISGSVCSLDATTGPYPEPDESIARIHTIKVHCIIILPSALEPSKV
jgi:hypothetical protein